MVSFYFPPISSIAAVRSGKFAKYLPQFGWKPVVLTADEVKGCSQNLPLEIDEADIFRTPYFALGPTISYELVGGQKTAYQPPPVISTWRKTLYKLIRLAGPIYTLPVIRTLTMEPVGWYSSAVRKGLEIINKESIDVIFSTYSPSTCHLIASRLHKQTGIPWVAEFRDLWSLNPNVKKVQPFHFFEKVLEKRVLKGSNLLVAVSEPAAEQLKMLHSKKAVTICNGFDEEDYLDDVPLTSKFTITYTGSIYPRKREPTPFFKAVAELKQEGKISTGNFEVRFFGGRTLASLAPIIKAYRLEKLVRIYGLVPFKESIKRQKESTVLLFLGWNDAREKGVYSGKVFEYLGARRPVLAIGLKGDVVDELLKETGVGVVVNEVNEIKAILSQWLEQFEQSGETTSYYEPNNDAIYQYTRSRETARLAQVLEEALKR